MLAPNRPRRPSSPGLCGHLVRVNFVARWAARQYWELLRVEAALDRSQRNVDNKAATVLQATC